MILHGHQSIYELRHLRIFLEVARQLSFSRAAEGLHIAQPAVSKAIMQLEDALDARLFDRDTRRVQLTPAGARLLETLPEALRRLESVLDETHAVSRGLRGLVRIGYVTASMTAYLPPVLDAWKRRISGLRAELVEGSSDDLLGRLRSGYLDACFLLHDSDDPDLRSTHVSKERLGVAISLAHRLTGRRAVRFTDLVDETIIPFARHLNPYLYDEVITGCRHAGFSPRTAHEDATRTVAVGLAAAGQGVALVSEGLAHLCTFGAVFRRLSPPLYTHYHLVVRRDASGDWLQTLTAAARV